MCSLVGAPSCEGLESGGLLIHSAPVGRGRGEHVGGFPPKVGLGSTKVGPTANILLMPAKCCLTAAIIRPIRPNAGFRLSNNFEAIR